MGLLREVPGESELAELANLGLAVEVLDADAAGARQLARLVRVVENLSG